MENKVKKGWSLKKKITLVVLIVILLNLLNLIKLGSIKAQNDVTQKHNLNQLSELVKQEQTYLPMHVSDMQDLIKVDQEGTSAIYTYIFKAKKDQIDINSLKSDLDEKIPENCKIFKNVIDADLSIVHEYLDIDHQPITKITYNQNLCFS